MLSASKQRRETPGLSPNNDNEIMKVMDILTGQVGHDTIFQCKPLLKGHRIGFWGV